MSPRTLARRLLTVLVLARASAGQESPPPETAPGVSVAARASKTEVQLGEPFAVDVEASGPPGTTWTFPAEAGDEHVELVTPSGPGGPEPAPGTHRYQAAAFALGETAVPAITVGYRLADGKEGTASTAALTLRILSTLPKDAKEQKLADIRGPLVLSVGRLFWIVTGVAALLVAALVLWLWRRRRHQPAEPARPEVAPDAAALAALDRLRASGLLARGEYRAFYIELAAIAKRYLEQRLKAPVLEMTSSEAVGFLRAHPTAHDLAPPLRDLAGAADRVKFARGAGLAEEAERHLAAVRSLVTTVEERLRPRPAPATEAEKVA